MRRVGREKSRGRVVLERVTQVTHVGDVLVSEKGGQR